MTKYLLYYLLAAFTLSSVPTHASGIIPEEEMTATAENIGITVTKNKVRITGAQGHTLEVYSITGAKVCTVKIDSNDKTVQLNVTRGYYIIKVATITRKVSLL